MRGPWKLAEDGCDRATAYHMSNKIVRRDRTLFVTWLDSRYRNVVATVDPDTGAVREQVLVGQGFDNHCGAAMTMTSDGVLHVVNGSHHRGFVYRSSADPVRPDSWSLPEAVGSRPTYPSLVADRNDNLHLTYRYSPVSEGRWGTGWCTKDRQAPWQAPVVLSEAPAPGYVYPTNALAVAPDGTIHLIIEWYKTYRDDVEPPHSMAVSHFESTDGTTWSHTNGRTVRSIPIRIEDADPVLFRGEANLRPGNVAVLPDGRPCFAIWDAVSDAFLLAVRSADREWKLTDLTPQIGAACPGTQSNSAPQVAVTPDATLIIAFSRVAGKQWDHATSQVHVVRVAPDTGRLLAHEPVPKSDPDEPDWIPSIEKGVLAQHLDAPYLSYITGHRGDGCVNDAQCAVNLVHLT